MCINRIKTNLLLTVLICMALTACEKKANPETAVQASTSTSLNTAPNTELSPNGVQISEAWARETAPGQSVGAAYMTLTSATDSTLVLVETDAAASAEIHSMSMENNVMKMRMLDALTLKAGKPEKLAPGGFHLMLFDLKAPLKAGEKVALTLSFKDTKGVLTHQNVALPIKAID